MAMCLCVVCIIRLRQSWQACQLRIASGARAPILDIRNHLGLIIT